MEGGSCQHRRPGADTLDGEEGLAYLRSVGQVAADTIVRAIAMMVAVTNLLDQAFMSVLLPLWARSSGLGGAQIVRRRRPRVGLKP